MILHGYWLYQLFKHLKYIMINNYKECLNVFKIYLKYKKKIYLTWKNVFYKKYSSIFSLRIIIINMYCQNLFKALRKKINLKIK
jgi:hypothetical protein